MRVFADIQLAPPSIARAPIPLVFHCSSSAKIVCVFERPILRRPGFLDKLSNYVSVVRRGVAEVSAARERGGLPVELGNTPGQKTAPPDLWVTEMGGAYNSGRPGVTDAFVSTFWFADALGLLALHGTQVVCRQTLIGGSYGLLSLGMSAGSMTPQQARELADLPAGMLSAPEPPPRGVSPDLWVAALWRRLMGQHVLLMSVNPVNASSLASQSPLRAYAACAAPTSGAPRGAVSLLLLNLHKASVEVDVGALFARFRVVPRAGSSALVGSPLAACSGMPLAPPVALRGGSVGAGAPSVAAAMEALPATAAAMREECAMRCALNSLCGSFAVSLMQPKLDAGGSGVGDGAAAAAAAAAAETVVSCALHEGGEQLGEHERLAGPPPQLGCFARERAPLGNASTWHEWRFTASALQSREAQLNGYPMLIERQAKGELPDLQPLVVSGAEELALAPRSVGFFLFPDAGWPEC